MLPVMAGLDPAIHEAAQQTWPDVGFSAVALRHRMRGSSPRMTPECMPPTLSCMRATSIVLAARHAPELWDLLPPPKQGARGSRPPQKCEGDGAPSGATSPSVHAFSRRRGASRRAVAAILSPRRRASRRRPGGYFVPPIRAASAALRLRHVQPLKAGPRSGAGRLARASRARGCETRPRAPALSPRPAQPVRVPSRTKRGGL